MRKFVIGAVAATLMAASGSVAVAANIEHVVDGAFSNHSGADLTNWVETGSGAWMGNRGQVAESIPSGKDDIFVAGSLMQTLSSMIVGETYHFSFDWKSLGSWSGLTLDVLVGTQNIFSLSSGFSNGASHVVNLDFVYDGNGGATPTLAFVSTLANGHTPPKNGKLDVDGVSVFGPDQTTRGVPGPVAGAGLPFLIAGVALYMRRRNARA